MSMSLVIERRREFAVAFSGAKATQCGAKGTQILSYRVRIGGMEKHLTSQGFIIDNNAIHDYFMAKYRAVQDFESCERIASAACRDFKAMFGQAPLELVKVRFVEVMVGGSPVAAITSRWNAGQRT